MKRRRFFQTVAALPAAPALLAQTQQPAPPTPGAQTPRPPTSNIPVFDETPADEVGDPAPKFFTAVQFATLRRLSDLLVPAIKGKPGALECEAPEFLDFLIGVSPADRQNLFRSGLDGLETAAKKKYRKSFGDLTNAEADGVVQPLLVPVAWAYDLPKDPMQHFLFEAHRDIRTATQNSRQYVAGGATGGRRGFGGTGQYLKPIDPIYRS